MFFKVGVLKNFGNFKEKNLLWSFILIKLQVFIRPSVFHTCHVCWICLESSDLRNHLPVSRFWCIFYWLAVGHYSFLFMFKWLGCLSDMPLSAEISRSFFKAKTFHLVCCKFCSFSIGNSIT